MLDACRVCYSYLEFIFLTASDLLRWECMSKWGKCKDMSWLNVGITYSERAITTAPLTPQRINLANVIASSTMHWLYTRKRCAMVISPWLIWHSATKVVLINENPCFLCPLWCEMFLQNINSELWVGFSNWFTSTVMIHRISGIIAFLFTNNGYLHGWNKKESLRFWTWLSVEIVDLTAKFSQWFLVIWTPSISHDFILKGLATNQ